MKSSYTPQSPTDVNVDDFDGEHFEHQVDTTEEFGLFYAREREIAEEIDNDEWLRQIDAIRNREVRLLDRALGHDSQSWSQDVPF